MKRRTVPHSQWLPGSRSAAAASALAAPVRADCAWRGVATSATPIQSYFAQVADDPSVQLVSQAQLAYARRALAGTEHAKLPLLSAAAPFKTGGRGGANYYTDIPAGPIAVRNVADLYIYPNTIKAVKISGAQVREWLEMSAGQFRRIDPQGAPEQDLINPQFRTYNFDVIDGVSYRIDVPASFDLSLETSNGSVSVTGVNGRIDAETSNGSLRMTDIGGRVNARTDNGSVHVTLNGRRWEGDGLSVTTSNGSARLDLPDSYNARLIAGTNNGSMTLDVPVTVQGRISKNIDTTLGSGGATIEVRTSNGSLRVGRR